MRSEFHQCTYTQQQVVRFISDPPWSFQISKLDPESSAGKWFHEAFRSQPDSHHHGLHVSHHAGTGVLCHPGGGRRLYCLRTGRYVDRASAWETPRCANTYLKTQPLQKKNIIIKCAIYVMHFWRNILYVLLMLKIQFFYLSYLKWTLCTAPS